MAAPAERLTTHQGLGQGVPRARLAVRNATLRYAQKGTMMGIPGGQRRILVKTEDAIRAADPGLASLLDTFGSLNRDEEMPQTEQLPADGRLHLGLLPGTLAARRESGARPFTRYAAIVLYALVVAFWVSWIVMASASAHSAACPSGKMVTAPVPGTTIATCKLSGELNTATTAMIRWRWHVVRRPASLPRRHSRA
jgi:hypothetical protein